MGARIGARLRKRHGAITLFATLNVLGEEGMARCTAKHRHQQYLSFPRNIDNAVPNALRDVCCASSARPACYEPRGVCISIGLVAFKVCMQEGCEWMRFPATPRRNKP